MSYSLKSFLEKAGALGAAAVLSAGMAAPAFAAASPVPVAGDHGQQADVSGLVSTITVTGIGDTNTSYDANGKIQSPKNDPVTVTAYQLVDGYYVDTNSDGVIDSLSKYVLIDPENGKIANLADQFKGADDGSNDMITSDEITAIANNINTGAFATATNKAKVLTLTKNPAGNYVNSNAEPGLYLILVTSGNDTVYNPAVVAVNLDDANEQLSTHIKAGTVDLNSFFQFKNGSSTTTAYVKSSKSEMDKKIVKSNKAVRIASTDSTGDQAVKLTSGNGDTVAYGDSIDFTIDGMTIPSFSKDYEAPKYEIKDTLDTDSFNNITALTLKINNGSAMSPANGKFNDGTSDVATITGGIGAKTFTISFTESWLRAHAADSTRPTVVVNYTTALSNTAGLNFAENLNHAEVTYSNDPADSTHYKNIKKNTYHYVFGIDADIDAQAATPSGNEETHEFNKVYTSLAESEPSASDYSTTNGKATGNSAGTKDVTTALSKAPLAGATFTLYRDEACTNPVKVRIYNASTGVSSEGTANYTAVSDANGHFSFTGLDEGTYYVKETEAPAKYTLNDTVFKFDIAATLADSGVMREYTVTTMKKSVAAGDTDWVKAGSAKYTATYTVDADTGRVTNSAIAKTVTPMEVVDTRLQTLPSTGGAGLYVGLTIAVTAVVAGYAISRKKKNESKANS